MLFYNSKKEKKEIEDKSKCKKEYKSLIQK